MENTEKIKERIHQINGLTTLKIRDDGYIVFIQQMLVKEPGKPDRSEVQHVILSNDEAVLTLIQISRDYPLP